MRITRHSMFMEIARTVSKRSTCHRLNVGAVITHDRRVVSIGYNGPASGADHCHGNACQLTPTGGCSRSIHAEANAVDFLERTQMGLDDLTIYCTHSPCPKCAPLIARVNIKMVIYEVPYRDESSIEWMLQRGIMVMKYSPSGYMFDHRDKQVLEA